MVTCVYVSNETDVEWQVVAATHCEIMIETSQLWRQRSKRIKSHSKVCLAEFAREDVLTDSASFYATLHLIPNIKAKEREETKEEKGILQVKLKFTSGTMKTKLNYALTALPFGSCKPPIKWQSKREANASRWVYQGLIFNIYYKSYFTGGDSDILYIIKGGGFAAPQKSSLKTIEYSEVWENERASSLISSSSYDDLFSWKNLLPTDRPRWSDENGEPNDDPWHTYEPSPMWEWLGEWQIDNVSIEGISSNGWLVS